MVIKKLGIVAKIIGGRRPSPAGILPLGLGGEPINSSCLCFLRQLRQPSAKLDRFRVGDGFNRMVWAAATSLREEGWIGAHHFFKLLLRNLVNTHEEGSCQYHVALRAFV